MEIKRCIKSFRASGTGASEGDLYPSTHRLVKKFPGLFEDVAAYVARRFPSVPAEEPTKKAPARKATARKPVKEG